MSKFLKIPYGDYTIEIQEGGEILLDTGPNQGRVTITGDLIVNGSTTTTINSTDTEISDNIITLNVGETGNGVTQNQSGLRIDRGETLGGAEKDVLFVFDETVNYLDPYTRLDGVNGVFGFYKNVNSNKLVAIRTNSILTDGSDLLLLGQNSGRVSVAGSGNYTSRITDKDDIPNKEYVDLAISSAVGSGALISENDTKVETFDFDQTGSDSNIDFQVDGVSVVNVKETETTLYDLRVGGNSISAINADDSIFLTVSGDGSVRIENILEIARSTQDPVVPSDGIKIYNKESAEGGTGVYFKDQNGRSDELISRNRALLYSMVI